MSNHRLHHTLDNMTEAELRTITNHLCRAIKERLPPDTGFCVLFFPFGGLGVSHYGSNCCRADMIEALREAADRLENREDVTR